MTTVEKRKHKRYVVDATCELNVEQATIKGALKNISFSGFYMYTRIGLSAFVGSEVDIKIVASLDNIDYAISGKSRIVRSNADGVGLFFIGMDDNNVNELNKLILNLRIQESEKK